MLLSNTQKTYKDQNQSVQGEKRVECWLCSSEIVDFDSLAAKRVCDCKGTLKYIHEQCLINWLETKLKKKKNKPGVHTLQCQRCHTLIEVKVSSSFTVGSWRQIKKKIFQMWYLWIFLWLLFFFLIFSVKLLLQRITLKSEHLKRKQMKDETSYEIVGLTIIDPLALLMWTCALLKSFILRKKYKISEIQKCFSVDSSTKTQEPKQIESQQKEQ